MYQKPKEQLAKRGIELKEYYSDEEISFELLGSRISLPQRYQLLALLILLFTLIKPSLLLFLSGISLAFWSSRRFKLSVSSLKGVELQLIVLLPYKRIRLPLIDTQIKQFTVNDRLLNLPQDLTTDPATSSKKMSFVSLVLTHPKLFGEPLTLLNLDQESGQLFSRMFASWLKLAHQKRNLNSKQPLSLFKHEPGEWVIALIDLFPQYLAPKSHSTHSSTRLTWWSVSNAKLLLSVCTIIGSCLLILFHAPLGLGLITLTIMILMFSRESIYIEKESITWQKKLLGIPFKELMLSKKIYTTLEEDLHAPSGRHLLVCDPVSPFNMLVVGQAWDAAWIHKELCKGIKSQN